MDPEIESFEDDIFLPTVLLLDGTKFTGRLTYFQLVEPFAKVLKTHLGHSREGGNPEVIRSYKKLDPRFHEDDDFCKTSVQRKIRY
jgi:hypothetical protein